MPGLIVVAEMCISFSFAWKVLVGYVVIASAINLKKVLFWNKIVKGEATDVIETTPQFPLCFPYFVDLYDRREITMKPLVLQNSSRILVCLHSRRCFSDYRVSLERRRFQICESFFLLLERNQARESTFGICDLLPTSMEHSVHTTN